LTSWQAVQPDGATAGLRTTVEKFHAFAKQKYGPLTSEVPALYAAETDAEAAIAQNMAGRDLLRTSQFLWAQEFKSTAAGS
jgi:hypothetical protein